MRNDEPENPIKIKNPGTGTLALLAAVFVVSRIILYFIGVRFNMANIESFWQFIDTALLKSDLFRSLFYLHSQPPLFNLLLGAVLKLCPGFEAWAFGFVYFCMGLSASLCLFTVMVRLGVSEGLGFILTVLFVISPSTIMYENRLFYTYPIMFFLCLSAFFLHRFLVRERFVDGFFFFGIMALSICTRSMFHYIWFLAAFGMLIVLGKPSRRKVALCFIVPFLAILLLYGKNYVLFGEFSSSTWMGMSAAKIATKNYPLEERKDLVEKGRISAVSLIDPFSEISLYKPFCPEMKKRGIPVLDDEYKSTGGKNYNHPCYIEMSRIYLKDSITLISMRPDRYVFSAMASCVLFLYPPTDFFHIYDSADRNLAAIRPLDRFYHSVLLGQSPSQYDDYRFPWKDRPGHAFFIKKIPFFLVAVFFLSLFFGFYLGLKNLTRKHSRHDPLTGTVLFCIITIVYITGVSTWIEIGENMRYQYVIDPFVLVLFALFIQQKIVPRIRSGFKHRKNLP